jgi:hypothetical protein
MNIADLRKYMKLIFVKNVKNNDICYNIFKPMLNLTLKNNTKSFMKDFENIWKELNLSKQQVVENINTKKMEAVNNYQIHVNLFNLLIK